MKAVILLNGEPYTGEIDTEDAYVYCCDGAYEWAKGRVKIDETLGDFDSLSYLPEPAPRCVYPAEKDKTDGELALECAIAAGYRSIEIYGGGGGREDHFIGNLHLLYAALIKGVKAVLITENARIFAAKGRVELAGEQGKTVSVAPFGAAAHIIESRGLKYPLPETLLYGSTRGISNVVLEEDAGFTSEDPVLVFVNCREVCA